MSTSADRLYETVAHLFAVTVLIDGVKHDRELIEFAHACCFHNRLIRPTQINPRETVITWFHNNAPRVEKHLKGSLAEDYVRGLLRQVTDPAIRQTVLSSIYAISVADSELHPNEEALINMAKSLWNIALPTGDQLLAVVE